MGMHSIFSDTATSLFKSILNSKIVRVRRQLYDGDFDVFDYEQNADGPVELDFDNGVTLYFAADTESFSVKVGVGAMPIYCESYKLLDLSNNDFWRLRVGKIVDGVSVLKGADSDSVYLFEFGVELLLAGGISVLVEYLDSSEFPDMIKVSEKYVGLAERDFIG